MSVNNVSKYPISNSVQQNTFKLKELDMRFEGDALKIRLKSPLLNARNYTITLENGVLTLRVITEKLYLNKNQIFKTPVFTESFLSIPDASYMSINKDTFVDDCLYITIGKKQVRKSFVTPHGVT